VYGEGPLTVLGGKITQVGDDWVTLEGTARIRLGLEIDSEKLTLGTRVLVRARRIRGQYVAESVIVEQVEWPP
jgi:hypothetical protein